MMKRQLAYQVWICNLSRKDIRAKSKTNFNHLESLSHGGHEVLQRIEEFRKIGGRRFLHPHPDAEKGNPLVQFISRRVAL